jgi:uroporphyrinogen decarboxylase
VFLFIAQWHMFTFAAPQTLSREIANKSTLIGFVGAPWTLAAYSIEGGKSKDCGIIKAMMLQASRAGRGKSKAEGGEVVLGLLDHLADSIARYAAFQV